VLPLIKKLKLKLMFIICSPTEIKSSNKMIYISVPDLCLKPSIEKRISALKIGCEQIKYTFITLENSWDKWMIISGRIHLQVVGGKQQG